ncbi:hypothetical protein BKA82DRAFT_4051893 [Pisolithus tinctorius]|nr:hypothetical protein BKA82DRAFT_4051893 [Pisolithus tinctorius]
MVHQYRCLRSFRFVNLRMAEHDDFTRILQLSEQAALSSSTRPLLLDIGCCRKSSRHHSRSLMPDSVELVGMDLRYLPYVGYPALCLLGCDLRPEFIDLGYRFYGDRGFSKIHFFSDDILQLKFHPRLIRSMILRC